MKRLSILYAAIAVGLSLASCGSETNNASNMSDGIEKKVVADTITNEWILTDNGIGGVTLGMSNPDIPDSIGGLYDYVDKYEGKSFIGFSFVKDSIEMFNAEDTDFDGKINLIALRETSPLKATTGNGLIYIGMPESELLNPKGNTLVINKEGAFHIGNFKVQIQDGKVSEIYIEWSPKNSK